MSNSSSTSDYSNTFTTADIITIVGIVIVFFTQLFNMLKSNYFECKACELCECITNTKFKDNTESAPLPGTGQ